MRYGARAHREPVAETGLGWSREVPGGLGHPPQRAKKQRVAARRAARDLLLQLWCSKTRHGPSHREGFPCAAHPAPWPVGCCSAAGRSVGSEGSCPLLGTRQCKTSSRPPMQRGRTFPLALLSLSSPFPLSYWGKRGEASFARAPPEGRGAGGSPPPRAGARAVLVTPLRPFSSELRRGGRVRRDEVPHGDI